jgi:hypothetical protein
MGAEGAVPAADVGTERVDARADAGGTERVITAGRRAGLLLGTTDGAAIARARGNMERWTRNKNRKFVALPFFVTRSFSLYKKKGSTAALFQNKRNRSMNVVIGTAAFVGGTLLSDEILARNLPIDGGILRLLFAPIHPCVGGLYALAATGSAPVLSTALITAGVLVIFDMDDASFHYSENVPPLRPIKNALRQLVAYLMSNLTFSFSSPKMAKATVDEKDSGAAEEELMMAASKVSAASSEGIGFLASLAVGPIKAQLDEIADADEESEYVFC